MIIEQVQVDLQVQYACCLIFVEILLEPQYHLSRYLFHFTFHRAKYWVGQVKFRI